MVSHLGNSRQREIRITSAILLTPAIIMLLVYIYYSVAYGFYLSMLNWNGIDRVRPFAGLDNWIELAQDNVFWRSAYNNMLIVVLSLLIQHPIAIAIAFILHNTSRKVSGPLKVIYYLPALFSSAAVGLLFMFIYSPLNGVWTTLSRMFGGGIVDLLGNPDTSLLGVFTVISWTAIPFYMLFYAAAMSGQSRDVFEASMIDGCSLSKYLFRVMLPMLKPYIQTAFTLSLIGSLKYFDLIFIMTAGGPHNSSELMATYMFQMAFRFRRMGYGSTVASGMFIIVVVASLLFLWLFKKVFKQEDDYA